MLHAELLASVKKHHGIEEKSSKEEAIKQLLKQYPQPSSLLEEKSPSAKLIIEFRQFLTILQVTKSQRELTKKINHLGFAKQQVQADGGTIPKNLFDLLQDLETITQKAAADDFPAPLRL